jgi:hypothetical protein
MIISIKIWEHFQFCIWTRASIIWWFTAPESWEYICAVPTSRHESLIYLTVIKSGVASGRVHGFEAVLKMQEWLEISSVLVQNHWSLHVLWAGSVLHVSAYFQLFDEHPDAAVNKSKTNHRHLSCEICETSANIGINGPAESSSHAVQGLTGH